MRCLVPGVITRATLRQGERNQFKQDSKFHNVPFPIAYPHVNLKQVFSEAQGLPKRYGMAEALQLAGIALEGTHHRGIDDARNIAKLSAIRFRQATAPAAFNRLIDNDQHP